MDNPCGMSAGEDITPVKRDVWQRKINAKINGVYYRALAAKYRKHSLILDFGIGLTSSGTILSWAMDKANWLVPFLSAASGLLIMAGRFLRLGEKIVTLDHTAKVWHVQEQSWDALWLRVCDEPDKSFREECTAIRAKDPEDIENQIEEDKPLHKSARERVFEQNGLKAE